MSEDGDVDVESAEDVPEIGGEATATTANQRLYGGSNDRRAHHNALERRRRDHIKDSFASLRDCIPSLVGEKVSRAHVLNKATEYIRHMQKNGSTREDDICDLARKNEVLEEQVRALEDVRTRGSNVNPEEVLANVATRVQTRQSQEMITQQQHQAKISKSRSSGGGGGTGGVVSSNKANPSPRSNATPTVANHDKITSRGNLAGKNGEVQTTTNSSSSVSASPTASQTTPLSPNLSLLASKLKNPQSFLAALQKTGNFPQNIKNLAACVLASPLMKGVNSHAKASQAATSTIPRGIVTATTVPKVGGISLPVSKPSTSIHVSGNTVNIQQPTPTQLSTQSPASPSVTLATLVEEALKKSDHGNLAGNEPAATSISPTPPTPANLLSPVQAPPIVSSSPTATSQGLVDTNQLASSLLEVHNLLQQQERSTVAQPHPPAVPCRLEPEVGVANHSLAGLSPDLLAQVSSILNLPSLSSGGVAPSSSSQVLPGNFSLNSQGNQPSPTASRKRQNSSSGTDSDSGASKKPHLEQ